MRTVREIHLTVLDGEQDKAGARLLEQWLVCLGAVEVADKPRAVLFNLLGDLSSHGILDARRGSSLLELFEDRLVGRLLGDVQVEVGQGGRGALGRGLDDGGHGAER